ncbi:MAG: hypothetical protein ALECFALPRED_006205 [Alectoria fallacina]|uniref:Methyltransferase domain-containing protein n=1 Tax=Alectoria fallacina TaxID=1903189 RepID=A0A8H3IZE3_9LECA|nr:MAG: hypothetical protein ALECFALPRED_006205 [Alectoria fallacina]
MSVASKDVPPLNSSAESWSTASASYAERVGRMCQHAADHLVQEADTIHAFSTHDSYVLDVGTGAGAVPESIIKSFPGVRILATDIAPGMVEAVDKNHLPDVSTRVTDASQMNNVSGLGVDATFSHAFSTFMIMFTLEPINVISEMQRVLRPGGVIGLALWGEVIGPNNLWEEACQMLDPTYRLPSPFADPNAWRTPHEAENALREVGFKDIHTEVYKVPFEFEDTASYLRFWYGAKNPVSDRFKDSFKGDQEEAKKALEMVLKERYNDATSIVAETILAIGRK